jgi:type I restriction enzyme M protein
MSIRKKVTKHCHVRLGDLINDYDGMANGKDLSAINEDGKRHYTDNGLPYLRVGDVKENEIDLVGAEKIDITEYNGSSIPKLQVGDLLITRKGTTGRAAVVSEDEISSVLSSEIIRVRLRKKIIFSDKQKVRINPYYVAAFINSEYGKALIEQKQTGGISEGINHPDLKEIEIPILAQAEMDKIANDYSAARKKLKEIQKYASSIPSRFSVSMANL